MSDEVIVCVSQGFDLLDEAHNLVIETTYHHEENSHNKLATSDIEYCPNGTASLYSIRLSTLLPQLHRRQQHLCNAKIR